MRLSAYISTTASSCVCRYLVHLSEHVYVLCASLSECMYYVCLFQDMLVLCESICVYYMHFSVTGFRDEQENDNINLEKSLPCNSRILFFVDWVVDWWILTACQPSWGYFMPRSLIGFV